jgi:hypothetical protein
MIIHFKRKLAAKLPDVSNKPLVENSPLGSWHAHLLYFDRRQCVIFCHDLEPYIYDVPNVLNLDPVAASARVSQCPATIAGEWIQPDVELLKFVKAL